MKFNWTVLMTIPIKKIACKLMRIFKLGFCAASQSEAMLENSY